MRIRLLCAALVIPALAPAQTPTPPLDVAVRVASVTIRRDTIELGYVVQNRAGSTRELWILGLSTPATILSLSAPQDAHGWTTQRTHGTEPMPMWAAMGDNVVAGQSSPRLTLRAIGITDLVPFVAVPDLTLSVDSILDDTPGPPRDQFRVQGTTGQVVSVVPPRTGETPAQQITRIEGFLTKSCGPDRWITSQGVCHAFSVMLDRAGEAFADGKPNLAKLYLKSFLLFLEAQHGSTPGKHVTDPAYALLKPNVAFLAQ